MVISLQQQELIRLIFILILIKYINLKIKVHLTIKEN